MNAIKINLTIKQGATFKKVVTWQVGKPLTPVDLTGCTARAQVREDIDSAEVLLELTTENHRVVLGGVAGTIELYVSAEDTALINWERGAYDLNIILANGEVVRRLEGSVSVSKGVTR